MTFKHEHDVKELQAGDVALLVVVHPPKRLQGVLFMKVLKGNNLPSVFVVHPRQIKFIIFVYRVLGFFVVSYFHEEAE